MIINREHKNRLIDLVRKDLKENPYNREMLTLLKELESIKFKDTPIMSKEDAKYVVDITKVFQETGLLNISDGNIKKEELENVKKFMKKVIELENLKKSFYETMRANIDDYGIYKSQVDTFCMKIGEIFIEMGHLI